MGLADEVKQAKQNTPAPEAEAQPTQDITEMMNSGMPGNEPAEKPAPEVKASEEPKESKIKIGDQEFDSPEKAIEYAQDLERAKLADDAYKKGFTDAQPAEKSDEPSFEQKVSEMFFENPEEAIKLIREKTKEEAKQDITVEQQRKAQEKQTWDNFYKENSDLANHRDLVEYTLQKNWNEVAYVDLQKGLKALASKARETLKGWQESSKPEIELPTGRAQMVGVTGDQPPAPAAPVEKNVDFVSQVNKLRKRSL